MRLRKPPQFRFIQIDLCEFVNHFILSLFLSCAGFIFVFLFVCCIFLCSERGYRLHVINKTNTLECCQHNNRFNHSISIYFSYIIFRFRRHSVSMSFLRISIKKKTFPFLLLIFIIKYFHYLMAYFRSILIIYFHHQLAPYNKYTIIIKSS